VAHVVRLGVRNIARNMMLTYSYRLLPSKSQHRALERILEDQRQLYNAGLEERIDAYRKSGVFRTYVDQCGALTEWRHEDAQASALPLAIQRWTLKQLDEAYRGFFRRRESGGA
jgi:putative transposase